MKSDRLCLVQNNPLQVTKACSAFLEKLKQEQQAALESAAERSHSQSDTEDGRHRQYETAIKAALNQLATQ